MALEIITDDWSTYVYLFPKELELTVDHSQEINNTIWVDYLADGRVYGVQLFPGMPKDFDND